MQKGETFVVPDGVETIKSLAFEEPKNNTPSPLKSVTLPESVALIEKEAFVSCFKLENISIPKKVKIEKCAFVSCKLSKEIEVAIEMTVRPGENVTEDGKFKYEEVDGNVKITLFKDRKATDATIPEEINRKKVVSIGDSAFRDNTSLTQVAIPIGVTEIGNYAFNGCTSLAQITIPDGVTRFGADVFYNCESLVSIKIPNGITSLTSFKNCKSLESVVLPDSIKGISIDEFAGCESL